MDGLDDIRKHNLFRA